MNYHDSEELADKLVQAGFLQTEKVEEADFVIVNTCTVTHSADRKSRQSVMHLKKLNPETKVIVMGCGVEVNAGHFKEKGEVGLVSNEMGEIVRYIIKNYELRITNNKKETENLQSRTRTNIKIQTGCDNYCSYCIIPFARGKSESIPENKIIAEIQKKEKLGFKEIIITGINIGAYGASLTTKAEENTFAKLLNNLLIQTNIPRIRLSSIGPQYFSDELIEMLTNPRICQHLHLSIQSGSNAVLKRMNRTYTIESVIELAEKLRIKIPEIALTSDIIVGFPEETEQEFEESLENLEKIKLMKTHIFPYSVRKGTVATGMKQIEHKVKMERKQRLNEIAKKMRNDFIESQIGKSKKVLFELRNKNGLWEGYTDNYIRVGIESEENLENKIREIKLKYEVLCRD